MIDKKTFKINRSNNSVCGIVSDNYSMQRHPQGHFSIIFRQGTLYVTSVWQSV